MSTKKVHAIVKRVCQDGAGLFCRFFDSGENANENSLVFFAAKHGGELLFIGDGVWVFMGDGLCFLFLEARP